MIRWGAFSTADGRASPPRVGALLAALVLFSAGGAVTMIPATVTQTGDSKLPRPEWTLRPNGTFGDIHAIFFRQERRLHVYTPLTKIINEKTGKFEPVPEDEMEPAWKGEPYYHDSYELKDGFWAANQREFSQGPEDFVDWAHCDQWNRRNLQIEKAIKRELPARIKVKAIYRFPRYVVVVYTDPSQQSPSELNYPPLEADLLVPDLGGWRIADSQEVDEYGYFCGSETFDTQLANGETVKILLVYTEDIKWDQVQSYLIEPKRHSPGEK